MTKIIPSKKLDFSVIAIGDKREVHAASLASFKARVWKYNKDKSKDIKFEYSDFTANFCTATRTK